MFEVLDESGKVVAELVQSATIRFKDEHSKEYSVKLRESEDSRGRNVDCNMFYPDGESINFENVTVEWYE